MNIREPVDTEFLDSEGVAVGGARTEMVMVLEVALALLFLAIVMWFAVSNNLFGADSDMRPSSSSISPPIQPPAVANNGSRASNAGVSLNSGKMTPDQAKSYIQTQDPNVNANSWPK